MNWFEQEVHQGELRGELRGERKGYRATLLEQLRLRFGELPAAAVARVEAADIPELDAWIERVLTASQIEDVLGPLNA